MNEMEHLHRAIGRLILLTIAMLWLGPAVSLWAADEKFDVLQIGTTGYTNVTVTTKSKTYILILHSKGMTSIKVKELPLEILVQLGYANPNSLSPSKNPAAWAKQELSKEISKLPLSQMPQVQSRWSSLVASGLPRIQSFSLPVLLIFAGVALAGYFGFCYCAKLICEKAGGQPGGLIWLPLVQLVPLIRAAGMSPVWIVLWLIPFLNLVAQAVWSVRIVRACGKSLVVAVLMWLPLVNLAAFLYLAFSSSAPAKEQRVVEVMTLEAA